MNVTALFLVPIHLLVTGSALAVLLLIFLWGFALPAWRQFTTLRNIVNRLGSDELKDARDPNLLDAAFPEDAETGHLWREYKKTLYAVPEEAVDGDGSDLRVLIKTPGAGDVGQESNLPEGRPDMGANEV
jgi:hypothetical protein